MVFMGYNPQESLENTLNTMGTLLGVHSIVPWKTKKNIRKHTETPGCNGFFSDFSTTLGENQKNLGFFLKKKQVVQVSHFY